MSKYKYLLWDLDGTILNFKAAERAAMKSMFLKVGFGELTDEMLLRYQIINESYWAKLEQGLVVKKEMLVQRFINFFQQEGLDTSIAEQFNHDYLLSLGDTIVFCDDAYNLIQELKKDYRILLVTNGTSLAQHKKLKQSGIGELCDGIYISEEVGYEKPNKNFFEAVFKMAGIQKLEECLIIGDSLTSDMKGGNTSRIDTCWYNPNGLIKDSDVIINYEISNLSQLKSILK